MILKVRMNSKHDAISDTEEINMDGVERYFWMYDGGVSFDYMKKYFESYGYYQISYYTFLIDMDILHKDNHLRSLVIPYLRDRKLKELLDN